MNHRIFLRRALFASVLAAVLAAGSLPASAFFLWDQEDTVPTVAEVTKNGPAGQPVVFSAEDFVVEDGEDTLSSITITRLPDAQAGMLTLGGQPLQAGDVVQSGAMDGLSFLPLEGSAATTAEFSFLPVFSSGVSGEETTAQIYLLSEENNAPVAENLELSTYKNVAITAEFAAVDPEGDLLSYHIINKPARGAVTLSENSSSFVYTPYENKTGKDSFTYVAVDAVGNASDPATVKIRIAKPDTKVSYADMDQNPAHKAAIRLAEEEIFVGECMGGEYFFQPDTPVSRSEFVAMTMNAVGLERLEDVERTGFFDDSAIPTWAKPYVSSALQAGLVQGSPDATGQIVFQADQNITAAEAAVLLDRALQVTDVSMDAMKAEEQVPAWAAQSAANLATCGVVQAQGDLQTTLTRADAAEMLCSALELMDSRDSGGLFSW
ncbi:Ig-like domain-containing protein [Flavonifractor hominis]|uniref:Ig-like domain-containing protein n=1 Tax=Flavonifractor hominis TaxID=3133178 RepID=A0ABV1ELT5_9FIRM